MFWVLGIPAAALWGAVAVFASVLPVVGAFAVWGPGVVYLAVTGAVPRAIVLAIWGAIVVSGIDNVLRPRLVAGSVGLSELAMFFALLGGLSVFGALRVLGPSPLLRLRIVATLRDPDTSTRMRGEYARDVCLAVIGIWPHAVHRSHRKRPRHRRSRSLRARVTPEESPRSSSPAAKLLSWWTPVRGAVRRGSRRLRSTPTQNVRDVALLPDAPGISRRRLLTLQRLPIWRLFGYDSVKALKECMERSLLRAAAVGPSTHFVIGLLSRSMSRAGQSLASRCA